MTDPATVGQRRYLIQQFMCRLMRYGKRPGAHSAADPYNLLESYASVFVGVACDSDVVLEWAAAAAHTMTGALQPNGSSAVYFCVLRFLTGRFDP
ncbi:hypothetical protein DSCOOX_08800 [Desulfosarcina ovata subsp. ovata]|uniref:Uncharacterized protein n=1 Tax=Desulfosarcina ovata subsp. ovata TaxID=2752305 RepID=A0A5K8A699_9BACT|nr:hypothetical protein DSCOOX_08800 [Desulfosarcina ovata subsp. ovata]